MSLKLHIREIRKAQGLTLATVAGRVGISVPHLSGIERGDKNLNNHLMERISSALGVQPTDLISGDEPTPLDDLLELREVMADLDSVSKAQVVAYAAGLRAARQAREQSE